MKRRFLGLVLLLMLFLCGCDPSEFGEALAEEIVKTDGTADVNGVIADYASQAFGVSETSEDIGSGQVVEGKSQEEDISESSYVYSRDKLEVHFIDVGQGDAMLLLCDGEAMLIDAGDNDKGTLVQNYIFKQGVGRLKYVVGTHPDADHYGGLDVIITKFDCGDIILPSYERATASCRDVYDAISYKGYSVMSPDVGTVLSLGGANITILAPVHYDYGDEVNNYSIALLVEHGKNKFLFTGDAENEAETDMVNTGRMTDVDVYKAGHHGSSSSSTSALLDSISPEYAVISCGENNDYGHPHAAVLNRLRKMGVKVFRTDEQGSIIAYSDGNEITWNCMPSVTWKAGEYISSEGQ